MARYAGDMNKVVLRHESGTYANAHGDGVWAGQVSTNSISDDENYIFDRYMGTNSRNYSDSNLGPQEVTGTLTYNIQDHRFPFWAIGSVVDTSGATSVHEAFEIATDVRQSAFTSGTLNPPISWTLEDSKQAPGVGKNFVRTIQGCVIDEVRLSSSQGEKVTCEVDYVANKIVPSSGTTTAVTEITTTPYMWSNCSATVSGVDVLTATEVELVLNRNATGPHYVDSQREASVPVQENADYTFNLTIDLDSEIAMMLYNFKQNNTAFNSVFDLDADSETGSQHAIYTMSGCIVAEMDPPSESEGLSSTTVEIRPQSVTAKSWDTFAAYNPDF